MLNLNSVEIQFALKVVEQAVSLAQHVKKEAADASFSKKDQSPVTVADYAIQAVAGYWLEQYFPKDALVAEESTEALRKPEGQDMLRQVVSHVNRHIPNTTAAQICEWIDRGAKDAKNRYWTLDPVDGTKGYMRGGQYAVALALVEDGKVQIGILGCPNLNGHIAQHQAGGAILVAKKNEGAWITCLKGSKRFSGVRVSGRSDMTQARIVRSFESSHTDTGQTDAVWKALGIQTEPILMDSQAKHAMVAAGGADLFFHLLPPTQQNYRISVWDQAAGTVIVEEAGGRVTDLEGKPFDFSTGKKLTKNIGVLISNNQLHARALEAMRQTKLKLK